MILEVRINGKLSVYDVKPNTSVMDFLRSKGYYSVKNGCNEGSCGSCTILVDNVAKKACIMFVGQIHKTEVVTAEGLGTPEQPHPIQDEFVQQGAIQCGFCIPGMILAAHALLLVNPNPSDYDVKEALNGNLCRCTGYVKQITSVQDAAKRLTEVN